MYLLMKTDILMAVPMELQVIILPPHQLGTEAQYIQIILFL